MSTDDLGEDDPVALTLHSHGVAPALHGCHAIPTDAEIDEELRKLYSHLFETAEKACQGYLEAIGDVKGRIEAGQPHDSQGLPEHDSFLLERLLPMLKWLREEPGGWKRPIDLDPLYNLLLEYHLSREEFDGVPAPARDRALSFFLRNNLNVLRNQLHEVVFGLPPLKDVLQVCFRPNAEWSEEDDLAICTEIKTCASCGSIVMSREPDHSDITDAVVKGADIRFAVSKLETGEELQDLLAQTSSSQPEFRNQEDICFFEATLQPPGNLAVVYSDGNVRRVDDLDSLGHGLFFPESSSRASDIFSAAHEWAQVQSDKFSEVRDPYTDQEDKDSGILKRLDHAMTAIETLLYHSTIE
jgi:hypothetical protein